MISRLAFDGVTLALTAAVLGLTGCGAGTGSDDTPSTGTTARHTGTYPIEIVTTCGMVTDIVRAVAGEHGRVTGLIGEGIDPHLYRASRSDIQTIMEADVVFYVGLGLEGRMADTFAKAGRAGKPVFPVTEGLDEAMLREPPEFAGHFDPHVWMDVAAWSQCVEFVAESLAEYDPPHAADYRRHAEAYRKELARLDEYVRQVISSIPDSQRVLVTAHDAFGYFSRAYDIEVRSVQGVTTESEAGVADVNALVDFLVERKLPAIFVESSVSSRNMDAVLEGAAQRGTKVTIGGELYSDAMGAPGSYEGTYIGMIDHNATTIARALGGEAPERGLNGKLRSRQ